MIGKLYLIPSPLGESRFDAVFPAFNSEIIQEIDHYIVEDARTERRFLKKLGIRKPIDTLTFTVMDKHNTLHENVRELLAPCLQGKHVGLLSDAGVPCIADPGHKIVTAAHQMKIQVVPLIGPCSIILSLMASGFNAQNFAFLGYLPSEQSAREKELRFLESKIIKQKQTQIFIETPYRNNHLLSSILQTCSPNIRLCVACDLTTEDELIISQTVAQWKKQKVDLHKRPAIFLLYI